MAPTPVGAPDVAFGAAMLLIGAAAFTVMSKGFNTAAGARREGKDRDEFGFNFPGGRARDGNGNQREWPRSTDKNKGKDKDGK